MGQLVGRRRLPRPPRAENRVLCVGGLSVGGAGRTPVVTALAERAIERGIDVAILGHGYRGQAHAPTRVTAPNARLYGDEAAALYRRLAAPIWVGADRARTLAAMPGSALVLADGGLLDAGLARQATVLVVDATASRRVLPAGPLRAPLHRVQADWTWLHRCDEPGAQPMEPVDVRSAVVATRVELADGRMVEPRWLAGRAVRVLTGVARPGSVMHLLDRLGARVVERRVRADHQWFSRRDLAALGPDWIVTAKDRARIPTRCPVNTLHIGLEVDPAALDRLIDAVVCAG